MDSDGTPFIHTSATHIAHSAGGDLTSGSNPNQTIHSSLRRRNQAGYAAAGFHPSGSSSVGGSDAASQQNLSYFAPSPDDELDTAVSLKQAVNAFKLSLGLEDAAVIKDLIHLRDVPAGAYLAKEDSSQVHIVDIMIR